MCGLSTKMQCFAIFFTLAQPPGWRHLLASSELHDFPTALAVSMYAHMKRVSAICDRKWQDLSSPPAAEASGAARFSYLMLDEAPPPIRDSDQVKDEIISLIWIFITIYGFYDRRLGGGRRHQQNGVKLK